MKTKPNCAVGGKRATKVGVLEYTCAGAGWHKLLDPGIPVLKKWRLREEVQEKFHGVLALNFGLKWTK